MPERVEDGRTLISLEWKCANGANKAFTDKLEATFKELSRQIGLARAYINVSRRKRSIVGASSCSLFHYSSHAGFGSFVGSLLRVQPLKSKGDIGIWIEQVALHSIQLGSRESEERPRKAE